MSRLPTKTHYLSLKSIVYGLYGSKVDCYAFSKAWRCRYRSSPVQLIVVGPSRSPDLNNQRFTTGRDFIELPSIDYIVKLHSFLDTYRVFANEPSYIEFSLKLAYYDRSRAYGLDLEKCSFEISRRDFNPEEAGAQRYAAFGARWLSHFDTGDKPLHVFKISRETLYEDNGYRYPGEQAAIFTSSQMDNLMRTLKHVAYSVLADRTVQQITYDPGP